MNDSRQTGYGATLRARREKLGLSLDDVANSTRVRKTYLQALEDEKLHVLPGAAYAVGFLRIYARQLGIPVDPLLTALAGAGAGEMDEQTTAIVGDPPRHPPKKPRKRQGGRLFFLLILLFILIAAYFYPVVRSFTGRPTPADSVTSPAVQPQNAAPVQPPAISMPPKEPATPPQGQPEITELPVIPAGGAVVRITPISPGVMKVSLDRQETREYQLQPDQPLNWKVTDNLLVELSMPGLVRVWVEQEEIPVAEFPAFLLTGRVQAEGRP
jgi:cytoskeletal protein RodZ